jgi:hypothetical protein
VNITGPANGTSVVEGTSLTFSGTATDAEDGILSGSLGWTSSEDGALGSGASVNATLSLGTHTITAAVTDGGGLSGNDQITVSVTAAPVDVPDVTGQTQASAEADLLAAGLTVGAITVPAGTVIDQNPTACSACADSGDPVDLVVSSGPPANTAPTLSITAPANNTAVSEGTAVILSATATDGEQGDLSGSVVWSSSRDGALGTGANLPVFLSRGRHTITATVTDAEGLQVTAQVVVRVRKARR